MLSALVALLIVSQKHRFTKSLEAALEAGQASHTVPTPRLGGVAILFGIVSSVMLGYRDASPWVFASVLPVFLIGLLEDFGLQTKPSRRLLMMSLSAYFVVYWTGVSITLSDTPFVDALLANWLVSSAFTVFFVVALTNGFNLIDGVNGLASSKVIFASLALSYVAYQNGDSALHQAGMVIAFSTFGVFVVNFPFGRIFMGDAGAYSLGFVLAWITILLNERHPDVSAWSLLCIISWPIFDTTFSIWRRLRSRSRVGAPDHLHYHQLVMRAWELISRGQMPRRVSNPLATITIWPITLPTIFCGAWFSNDNFAGAVVFAVSAVFFVATYAGSALVLRRRRLRVRFGEAARAVYDAALHVIRVVVKR